MESKPSRNGMRARWVSLGSRTGASQYARDCGARLSVTPFPLPTTNPHHHGLTRGLTRGQGHPTCVARGPHARPDARLIRPPDPSPTTNTLSVSDQMDTVSWCADSIGDRCILKANRPKYRYNELTYNQGRYETLL